MISPALAAVRAEGFSAGLSAGDGRLLFGSGLLKKSRGAVEMALVLAVILIDLMLMIV